jgi:hypothetical protein
MGSLYQIMGPSCEIMGPSCEIMGPSCEIMGPSCEIMGPSCEIMGPSCEIMTHFVGRFCRKKGVSEILCNSVDEGELHNKWKYEKRYSMN